MYDAVYPQHLTPSDYQVVAGYCGGDTPHVWSRAEWDSTSQRYRLPIWVRSNPAGHDGYAEAREFNAVLDSIGCPHGVTVGLDYETAVDNTYLLDFQETMWTLRRCVTALYGSLSTVIQNHKPNGGYWIADWDNIQNFPDGCVAHQYKNHPNYDSSVVSDSVVLWDTKPGIPKLTYKEHTDVFITQPNKPFYLPIEPAGTTTAPVSAFKYGPAWLNVTAQDPGHLTIEWIQNGAWVKAYDSPKVEPGGLVILSIPASPVVRMIRITSDVEIVGYIAASQMV